MTDNLKELTKKEHANAERQSFVSRLLKKEISKEEYAIYLYNQLQCYFYLEFFAAEAGIFDDFEEMKRARNIYFDFLDLWGELNKTEAPIPFDSTREYISYIYDNRDNYHTLLAHVYTRHFGDLSGGQILRNYVPGEARMYDFDRDAEELKKEFREKLSNDLAEESKVCFNFVTKLLKEMENVYTMESA